MITEIQVDIRNPEERERLFEDLYEETFPVVARMVSRQQGSFQDAKDIFQDALVILYEKSVQQETAAIDSPQAYLIGIAKHLWIRKFKTDYPLLSLDQLEQQITIPEEYFEVHQDTNRLLTLLERSGRKCLELLSAFYYERLSLDLISKRLGFSSSHSTAAQKHKCIDKLRTTIKEKSLHYEDFME